MTTHMDLWSPELVPAPVRERKAARSGYSPATTRAMEDRLLASMPGAGVSHPRTQGSGNNAASWQEANRVARTLEITKIMSDGSKMAGKDIWDAWPGREDPPSRQTILYTLRSLVSEGRVASDGRPLSNAPELFWIVDPVGG